MLRLVYSNRTEELLAELATRVRAEQRAEPLAPVRVVVPSARVEAYVKLGIARERGIAANLETRFLTRFASSLAPEGTRVADADCFQALVLSLLLDESFLARSELAPVLAYLRPPSASADAVDLRRVQLAARLGRIFEEYSYSRHDVLSAWRTGTTLDGTTHAETERWQRALYQGIFGEGGLASRCDPRVVTLSDALSHVEDANRPVHVFGFAHVARSFYDLFAAHSRKTEVVVYSLSPCEGFWEDIDRRDPAPLHLWGRPGRDHVRVLNALSGFDHDDRFVDPREDAQPTLLRRLQSDLLRRTSPASDSEPDGSSKDDSLTFAEHTSVRRELEAVASQIWDLLEKDESLRFDDIAVLVPSGEAERYVAHLPAVFREAHEIPHRLVGIAAPTRTSVLEAIELLLELPLGRFSRGELLRLVIHPSLVASFEDVDPSRWAAWCDSLGIVHGADRTDHEGTYIDRDILNWDQGLRRLALGVFMTGDGSGEESPPFTLGEDAYAPLEVGAGELRDAAAFGVLSHSLIEDARFVRGQTLTMPEWAELLSTMVSTYVTPTGPDETEELTRRLRQLQALAGTNLFGRDGRSPASPEPGRNLKVSYRVAYELATRCLGSAAVGSGSEGVVVSTIAGLRPIPFRVIFACGMGEGLFPSPDAEDPLDLRWAEPGRASGLVSTRDRDKYAFLELLLSARDRLVLSHVSRDAVTGDALAPSSVVAELLHALGRGYVADVSALRRKHPLRRWMEPGALPEARAEAATLALRQRLEQHGERLDVHEVRSRAEANAPGWLEIAEHLRLAAMPRTAPIGDGRVVVPMHALVKFLEFPLHGWARFRFGLDELEDDDILARESEPFETELREETLFLRRVFLDAKRRGVSVEGAYDAAVRERELRGEGPSGAFARGERDDHLHALAIWRSELQRCDVAMESLAVHRLGRGGERSEGDAVHEPLTFELDVLDGGTTRVLKTEIVGRTLPLGAAETTSVTLAKRVEEQDDEWARAGRRRTLLRSFVDHAVLCAAGQGSGVARSALIVVATPEGANTERITLAPLSRDKALVWLRGIVRELLGASHDYFFPYEAVFVQRERRDAAPLSVVLSEAREKLREGRGRVPLRSAYGPVPRPDTYRLPDEETARAIAASRFDALFAGWPGWQAQEGESP
jgi:exodeoxyribonuclease V gamma subunit